MMRWFCIAAIGLSCAGYSPALFPAADSARRVCVNDESLREFGPWLQESIEFWNDSAGCALFVPGCDSPDVIVTEWQPRIDDSTDNFEARTFLGSPSIIELKNPAVPDKVYRDLAHELGHVLGLDGTRSGVMNEHPPPWDAVGYSIRPPCVSCIAASSPISKPDMRLLPTEKKTLKGLCRE